MHVMIEALQLSSHKTVHMYTHTRHFDHLSLPFSFVHTPPLPAVETRQLCLSDSPQSSPTRHCMVASDRPHQTKRHSHTRLSPSSHSRPYLCKQPYSFFVECMHTCLHYENEIDKTDSIFCYYFYICNTDLFL